MPETNTIERGANTVGLSRSGQLLLVRLLPVGDRGGPGPKRLRDELGRLGADLTSDESWNARVGELRSAGLLSEGRGLRLTDAGRAHALQVLGLSELPPKATWPQIRDRYLVGLAAGRPGGGDGLRTKPKLAAVMLARRFGLHLPDGATAATAAAALVCKELGFPGLSDFKALQAAVLGRLLQAPQSLPPDDAVEQFLRDQFGAKRGKVDELRQALIGQWARGDDDADRVERPSRAAQTGPATAAPPAPGESANGDNGSFDLASFAAAARNAAATSPTGWFGDNKVFIAHAWRQFRANMGPGAELDLDAFKARLIEAHRAGLLTLSRADLVAAMEPAEVAESEARYLNATFHFVLIEGDAR